MSQDITSVVIVGRCTRDAELRYTASGTAICNFSVASGRRVKKSDNWIDETSFFDLQLWAKAAENLNKYLTKGQQVIVKGELRQERWEKDGQIHSKVTVWVDVVQLIGGKPGDNGGARPATTEKPYAPSPERGGADEDRYEDDIPF